MSLHPSKTERARHREKESDRQVDTDANTDADTDAEKQTGTDRHRCRHETLADQEIQARESENEHEKSWS